MLCNALCRILREWELGFNPHSYDNRTAIERLKMYLLTTDLIAITIVLAVSVSLVVTTALANARLTRKVEQLRAQLAQVSKK